MRAGEYLYLHFSHLPRSLTDFNPLAYPNQLPGQIRDGPVIPAPTLSFFFLSSPTFWDTNSGGPRTTPFRSFFSHPLAITLYRPNSTLILTRLIPTTYQSIVISLRLFIGGASTLCCLRIVSSSSGYRSGGLTRPSSCAFSSGTWVLMPCQGTVLQYGSGYSPKQVRVLRARSTGPRIGGADGLLLSLRLSLIGRNRDHPLDSPCEHSDGRIMCLGVPAGSEIHGRSIRTTPQ